MSYICFNINQEHNTTVTYSVVLSTHANFISYVIHKILKQYLIAKNYFQKRFLKNAFREIFNKLFNNI